MSVKLRVDSGTLPLYWEDSKPNLAAMIKLLAESYEDEARRHDENGLWMQES
jgi:hypothetical protein